MKNHVSFLNYHSTNTSYSSPFTCCSYQKDRRARPGNLPNKQRSFRNGGALDRKLFLLLFFLSLKVWSLEGMPSRNLKFTCIAPQTDCGGPIKLPTLLEMGYPTRGRQALCYPPVHFIRPRLWSYCNYKLWPAECQRVSDLKYFSSPIGRLKNIRYRQTVTCSLRHG